MRIAPVVDFGIDAPPWTVMLLLPAAGRSSQNARKIGNLLASGLRRLEGEGAGDGAEILAAGEGAEEGRALDDREVERLPSAELATRRKPE